MIEKVLFGGTFDPPHFGHILVAHQVREHIRGVSEVVFIPANTNPDKRIYASATDRLAMTRLLETDVLRVSESDITRGGDTFTKDTINILCNDTTIKWYYVIGSDLAHSIQKWNGFERFSKLVKIVVFPRPEYPVTQVPSEFIVLPKNKLLTTNYSSTRIRQRVKDGLSIQGLVPANVADYITKHSLYKN